MNDIELQAKIDAMTKDLEELAEKVRHLNSPLGAIRSYLGDMIEDLDNTEFKERLVNIDRISNKCISIVQDIVSLTMPYFESKSKKGNH